MTDPQVVHMGHESIAQTGHSVRQSEELKQPLGGASTPLVQGAGDHPVKGRDRVTSFPPSPPEDHPDPRTAERMSRVDGCPECVVNVCPPVEVREDEARTDGRRGFIAVYECDDCPARWTTGWEG